MFGLMEDDFLIDEDNFNKVVAPFCTNFKSNEKHLLYASSENKKRSDMMCPLVSNYCKSSVCLGDNEYKQCCMKSLIYNRRILPNTKEGGYKYEHISKNEV